MKALRFMSVLLVAGSPCLAAAAELIVKFHAIDDKGVGEPIGAVLFRDTSMGLKIVPALQQLTPGRHGFHVHQNPECGAALKDGVMAAGQAAGGHYDPAGSTRHAGPRGAGHLGDLPALDVGMAGIADNVRHAKRLTIAHLKGRSVVIHAGGDNYSDQPKPLGGGGARIACGVVP
ncbi:MAG: superoxide dismutase [Cu-Zn] SodC [Burkholderiales bacterium]